MHPEQEALDKAHKTLGKYQRWRRDKSDSPHERVAMPDPKEIGEAIDVAIYVMETMRLLRI